MSSTILTLLKRAAQNNPAKGVLFVQGNSESLVTYSQLLHHTQVTTSITYSDLSGLIYCSSEADNRSKMPKAFETLV